MNTFRKKLDKALEMFLLLLMVILLGDVLLQVVSRYLLENAVSFTDELAGFLLIWVSMAGAAYVTGKREHLAITLLHEKLGPAAQRWLGLVIDFLILLFAITVLLVGGSWLVYTRFYLWQLSASLEIPLGYVYLILPLSGLLIGFYMIDDIVQKSKT